MLSVLKFFPLAVSLQEFAKKRKKAQLGLLQLKDIFSKRVGLQDMFF